MRVVRSALTDSQRAELRRRLGELLTAREEVRFACLHGSVTESRRFRDVDVAVWLDPAKVPAADAVVDYEFELSAWLERAIPHPVDVKVLNHATLGFRYAATGGEPVLLWDPDEWFEFRERTWRAYLDFAPHAKAALLDLLRPTESP